MLPKNAINRTIAAQVELVEKLGTKITFNGTKMDSAIAVEVFGRKSTTTPRRSDCYAAVSFLRSTST